MKLVYDNIISAYYTMDIYAHIQKLKPDFKPQSVKAYAAHLTTTHKALYGSTEMPDVRWLVTDLEKVVKCLNGFASLHTRRNKLNAMLLVLSDDKNDAYKEYETLRDDYNNSLRKDTENHVKSDKQEQNWITKAEIDAALAERAAYLHKRKVTKMKTGEPTKAEAQKFHDYLLLKTVAELPSRNDFHSLKIVKRAAYNKLSREDEQNYIVTGHRMQIVVNSWKTKKSFSEPRVLALSTDLQKIVRAFIKQQPQQEHLFVDGSGNPYTRNSFTKKITRLFAEHFPGKSVSTTMLRHIFATEKNGDLVAGLEEDAKKLGHTVSTHLQYVKK